LSCDKGFLSEKRRNCPLGDEHSVPIY